MKKYYEIYEIYGERENVKHLMQNGVTDENNEYALYHLLEDAHANSREMDKFYDANGTGEYADFLSGKSNFVEVDNWERDRDEPVAYHIYLYGLDEVEALKQKELEEFQKQLDERFSSVLG